MLTAYVLLHSVLFDETRSGGSPHDGIPSIDDSHFVEYTVAARWLADNESVVALEINGDVRAYLVQILTRHEIANDTVCGHRISDMFSGCNL